MLAAHVNPSEGCGSSCGCLMCFSRGLRVNPTRGLRVNPRVNPTRGLRVKG